MRKFENKYFKREKEYIALLKELDHLIDIGGSNYRWKVFDKDYEFNSLKSKYTKVKQKLVRKFYNEFCGWKHTAPHFYRRYKNKRQKQITKEKIFNYMKDPEFEMVFEDNYSDCSWYW